MKQNGGRTETEEHLDKKMSLEKQMLKNKDMINNNIGLSRIQDREEHKAENKQEMTN